jgi:lysophospholipase L1-like esterase
VRAAGWGTIRGMRLRAVLGRVGLALGSAVVTVAVLETALRLNDYRFSPVVLVPPEASGDFRAFHLETDPLAVFDAELFWRPNPDAWEDMDERGFRGRTQARPGEVLVVAIGDSNTIGSPGAGEHWTADLQDLLDHNATPRPVRVINAGCFGWASLQGLRRFQQVLALRPAVVFFSFGANEAHRVTSADADYAERAAWLRRWGGLRLAAPVAHRVWSLVDRRRGERRFRPRVSLAEHRRHLEEFVDTARAHGVVPVLLTRPYVGSPDNERNWMAWAGRYRKLSREVAAEKGAACVDVHHSFAQMPQLFQDESHFNRMGRHRMAALLLRQLKGLGHAHTDYAYEPALEPGGVPDTRPELGPGWWAAEPWGQRRGRWTKRTAVAFLERRGDEDRLEVDLSLFSPRDLTVGRVEVNGRPLARIEARNGGWRRTLDVAAIPEREVVVRFVVDDPYVPRRMTAGAQDTRTLGVFVHAVRLQGGGAAPARRAAARPTVPAG